MTRRDWVSMRWPKGRYDWSKVHRVLARPYGRTYCGRPVGHKAERVSTVTTPDRDLCRVCYAT